MSQVDALGRRSIEVIPWGARSRARRMLPFARALRADVRASRTHAVAKNRRGRELSGNVVAVSRRALGPDRNTGASGALERRAARSGRHFGCTSRRMEGLEATVCQPARSVRRRVVDAGAFASFGAAVRAAECAVAREKPSAWRRALLNPPPEDLRQDRTAASWCKRDVPDPCRRAGATTVFGTVGERAGRAPRHRREEKRVDGSSHVTPCREVAREQRAIVPKRWRAPLHSPRTLVMRAKDFGT